MKGYDKAYCKHFAHLVNSTAREVKDFGEFHFLLTDRVKKDTVLTDEHKQALLRRQAQAHAYATCRMNGLSWKKLAPFLNVLSGLEVAG